MRNAFAVIVAATLATTSAPPARAAEPGPVAGLVRNAWYWHAREREDKAEQAWRRVLEIAPAHPDALAAVGGFEARAGRLAEARQRLAALERASPGHPDLPVLRRQVELGPRFDALLAEARRIAQTGERNAAVAAYRKLMGGAAPPGDLALEYYQTIAGDPGGWQEARDGLERVSRRAPSEARYRLALARVLTYRDATRRRGIEQLAALSRTPDVAREAIASWRQALLWLRGAPGDDELLRAFARAHPEDEEIARRIERGRRSGTLRQGFAALDRGDLAEAERLFDAAGPGEDARLGLALIAQRRAAAAQRAGDLARASALLERARTLAPGRPDVWQEPIASVRFWTLLRDARVARERELRDLARSKLRDALDVAPAGERWQVELALAGVDRDERRLEDAERRYHSVLAAVPDQPEALRALASILVEQGRHDEALPVNERLLRVTPEHAYRAEWLAAEASRATAALLRERGELAAAQAELEKARRADPANVWVLHDLANTLVQRGAHAAARAVLDELLRVSPGLVEARLVEARLLAAEGRDAEALSALSALPPAVAGSAEVVALSRRLHVKLRLPALLSSAALQDPQARAAAAQELAALEAAVQQDADLMAQIALAWSSLGDRERALIGMRAAMGRAPAQTRGLRVALASELFAAGDDVRFGELLDALDREPSLTPEERGQLGELRIAHAVRSADASRERGDRRAGFALLEPVLRHHPGDPRLLTALGRLHEGSEPRRAHAAFTRALDAAPDDRDARRGAISSALALRDQPTARRLAQEGLRLRPDDPSAHLSAARVAAAGGDDRAAMRHLERARAALEVRQATVVAAAAGQPLPEGAPRAATHEPLPPSLPEEIAREAARVRARHRPTTGGGFAARTRRGEPGLGRLTHLQESLEVELPIGFTGAVTFRASTVQLDAGALDPGAATRFAGGGRLPAGGLPQRAYGTEVALSYATRGFSVDAGTTPIGFPVETFVGGARLEGGLGPVRLALSGGRRSVTDSLLSYAGAKDPASERTWGGVVAEGGRLELGFGVAETHRARLRLSGGADRLTGTGVAENRRAMAGVLLEASVLPRGRYGDLAVGVNATALAYERNRSFFTLGHGGYFSPQRFVHVGVPVRWSGGGALRWEAVAEPAYHWSREQSAPISPLSSPAQRGSFAESRTEGFAFDARGRISGPLGPLRAGLDLGLQQAPEYRELQGQVVLRYVGRGAR